MYSKNHLETSTGKQTELRYFPSQNNHEHYVDFSISTSIARLLQAPAHAQMAGGAGDAPAQLENMGQTAIQIAVAKVTHCQMTLKMQFFHSPIQPNPRIVCCRIFTFGE